MPSGPRSSVLAALIALALAAGGCASGDDAAEPAEPAEPATTTTAGPAEAAEPAPPRLEADPSDCPPGFERERPEAGEHDGFESAGQQRSFHLLLPDEQEEPAPLFVALTGTVQDEADFLAQSRIDGLPDDGWIVVAPVRNSNGLLWPPWDAMRTAAHADLPNPDVTFIEELVGCLAAHHEIDATRVFVGGISIGGTMVNLLLRQDQGLFAGGIVGSGHLALTEPPDPGPLDDLVVIVAWGGDDDRWIGCPDGRMGPEVADEPGCVDVDFVADAAAASQFYDAAPGVRQVACSADVGHIWIAAGTTYMAEVLRDHPKGSTGEVELPPDPPDGLTCTTEAFTR